MFGFFKKNIVKVFSPLDGKVIELKDVPDEVFSKGLVGDGVAIIPYSGTVVSPIKGTISRIFSTKHACSIKGSGIEVMIHIGLDTVELGGEGFKLFVKEGDSVDIGTPIVSLDKEYIISQDKEIVTPIIISSKKKIVLKNKKIGIVGEGELLLEVEFV
jgi:PTS system glucose-specific IIA component